MQDELKWWLYAIPNAISNINITQVAFEICTNASESVWGATDDVNPIGGIWSTPDKANHMNFLELLAIKHILVNYRKMWENSQHIQVKSDIQHYSYSLCKQYGSIASNSCNQLAREKWEICTANKVWLTAVHILYLGKRILLQILHQDCKMKTLSGDYHLLFFIRFSGCFILNQKLIFLHV